jgi:predicted DNA-binding transcriptional regulator YafY
MTARELAQRLEVSERTVYRDIEALSSSGIPVYAERGPGGGCILPEGYRINLTGLTEDELRTLFITPLADLGMEKARDAALLKLLAALPTTQRQSVEYTRQRMYFDPVGWFYSTEASPFMPLLREAVWGNRRVILRYRKRNTDLVDRLVEPLGLVCKAGIWYLVALSNGNNRVYRISRVRNVALTDEHFQRPHDFDLEHYWKAWCVEFQARLHPYEVCLRIAPQFVPILPYVMGESIYQVLEEAEPPDCEGWLTIKLRFESLEVACGFVLGFVYNANAGTTVPPDFETVVEVLEPQELREAIIQIADRLYTFYRKRE